MIEELRGRLAALGYEFAESEAESDREEAKPEAAEEERGAEEFEPEEPAPDETEADETEATERALQLALRRALGFMRSFCNRLDWPAEDFAEWPEDWPWELCEAALDLAAAYFLQAKMSLTPEELAVMPSLTSLRMGDAAWGFGGGTQKSGTDALTRTEALAGSLAREAKAVLCLWRSI